MPPVVPNQPPPESAVSISAVAAHAGVSVATVSRVMNEQSGVRAPTRDKVLASVETLGYRMNHLARSLRTAESRMLLTMVPDVGNPFYAQIVRYRYGGARAWLFRVAVRYGRRCGPR